MNFRNIAFFASFFSKYFNKEFVPPKKYLNCTTQNISPISAVIGYFCLQIYLGFFHKIWVAYSDVFREQKSGLGRVRGLLFRVGFGDQHFGDVPLGFLGFRGFLR